MLGRSDFVDVAAVVVVIPVSNENAVGVVNDAIGQHFNGAELWVLPKLEEFVYYLC